MYYYVQTLGTYIHCGKMV